MSTRHLANPHRNRGVALTSLYPRTWHHPTVRGTRASGNTRIVQRLENRSLEVSENVYRQYHSHQIHTSLTASTDTEQAVLRYRRPQTAALESRPYRRIFARTAIVERL